MVCVYFGQSFISVVAICSNPWLIEKKKVITQRELIFVLMSTRQVRRLEQLLKSKQAASLDDPDVESDASEDDDRPSMQVRKPNNKKKKTKLTATTTTSSSPPAGGGPTEDELKSTPTSSASLNSPTPQVVKGLPSSSSSKKETTTTRSSKPSQKKNVRNLSDDDDDEEESSSIAPAVVTQEKTANRKKKNKQNRQEQDEADDALLDQVLGTSSSAACVEGSDVVLPSGISGGARSASDILRQALRLAFRYDATSLDPRKERIRAFGIDAVEDVGDGAHRRGGAPPPVINRLLPPLPPGVPLPKFRQSPLGTPNRYCWPPFSTLGVALQESRAGGEGTGGRGATTSSWEINWRDPDFLKAQQNFERCVSAMMDVNAFLQEGFAKYPYHLPTLVQLCDTFAVTGDTHNAALMLDLALYTVGVLLNRAITDVAAEDTNLKKKSGGTRQKTLEWGAQPADRPLTTLVFDTLRRGVHGALRKGCPRTAFQISRLTLSLQPSDPTHQRLLWDYLALRSRSWELLLVMYRAAMAQYGQPRTAVAKEEEGGGEDGALASQFLQALVCLPSFHFNAALAKFLMENAEEQQQQQQGSTNKKNSHHNSNHSSPDVADAATLHKLIDAFHHSDSSTRRTWGALPSARCMLAQACVLFPHAAVELCKKLELNINTSADKGWAQLFDMAATHQKTFGKLPSTEKVLTMFLERSFELWKPKEVSSFLSQSVALLARPPNVDDNEESNSVLNDPLAAREVRERLAVSIALKQFESSTVEDVMGAAHRVAAIAPELLNAAPMGEEAQREAHAWEYEQLLAMGMPQTELDALERFEAVFGPLPVEVPLHERFAEYERMLEGYTQQVGAERNPIRLFLETLLPWNNLRDMALQRAMEDRGVADPVGPRRARRRNADQRIWDAAQREADQNELDDLSTDSD